jgi:hypothetical protein
MSVVRALQVTRYTRDNKPYTTETLLEPTWDVLEHHLQTMDRYEKPILWLCQTAGIGDSNAMAICGGQDVYHIQIADSDCDWSFAVNPVISSDEIEVWTSDQGFTTQARFTWNLEQALEIVRWYFEHGTPLSSVVWQ